MRGSGLVLSDHDAGLAVGHGADRGGRAEDTWECRGASGVRKTFLAEAQRTQRTTKKQQSIFLRFSLCTLRLCEKSFLLLVFAFRQWLLVFSQSDGSDMMRATSAACSRSDMEQIVEAVRKIHGNAGALAA